MTLLNIVAAILVPLILYPIFQIVYNIFFHPLVKVVGVTDQAMELLSVLERLCDRTPNSR
jgi:hypothetical protein